MRCSSAPSCTHPNTCCCYPHRCPRGYAGDPSRACTCSASTLADLAGVEPIGAPRLAAAIQERARVGSKE